MGFWSRIINIFAGAAETVVSITVESVKVEAKRRASEKVAEALPDMSEENRVAVTNIINTALDELLVEVTKLNSTG
jgi:hypothetical protein